MTTPPSGATPSPADLARAERTAVGVGVVSSVLGAVLLLAPETVARTLGIRPDPSDRALDVIGVVDVVVGAGLLVSRTRSPWLLARAAANPPSAWWFLRAGLRDSSRPAVAAAALLGALTLADARTARTLRDAGR